MFTRFVLIILGHYRLKMIFLNFYKNVLKLSKTDNTLDKRPLTSQLYKGLSMASAIGGNVGHQFLSKALVVARKIIQRSNPS